MPLLLTKRLIDAAVKLRLKHCIRGSLIVVLGLLIAASSKLFDGLKSEAMFWVGLLAMFSGLVLLVFKDK